MNVAVLQEDHPQAALVLEMSDARKRIVPTNGHESCVGLMRVKPSVWFLFENNKGVYTLHVITDATEKEAWDYFDAQGRDCGGEYNWKGDPRFVFGKTVAKKSETN